MRLNPRPELCHSDKCITGNPVSRYIVLVLLFAAALGIRFYNISDPPIDFAPIRQYQNAHIARGLFYETNDSISEGRKRIARVNMERMGFVLEPRIIENSAVLGYRLAGAEHLWIPRVLSSIFWVVGGAFLYLIAGSFFSHRVALFSTSFYLFLPYSILSSRTFQPDPLMLMMILGSIYGIMKYDEGPSRSSLFLAAVVASVAVIVKPYCVFIIFGVFFSMLVFRKGLKGAVLNGNTLFFGFLIVLPSIIYYGYNILTSTGFLGEHAKGSFLPHLYISLSFWEGWLHMIGRVTGYVAFILAIFGLFRIEQRRPRALLLGLWPGYFIFGLSAPYQIHTHSYYHMPLIPIVSLSLAPIAGMLLDREAPLLSMRIKKAFFIVLLVIGLGLFLSTRSLPLKTMLSEHKSDLKTLAVFVGINPEFSKLLNGDIEKKVKIAKEIGEFVGHSTNTVFLTPYFGRVLAYHGEFAGLPWPTSNSLYARSVRGERIPNIKDDFTSEHITLLYQGRFIKYTPDFFIITAFDEFDNQPDLKEYLFANYPVLVRSENYLVFDMRRISDDSG